MASTFRSLALLSAVVVGLSSMAGAFQIRGGPTPRPAPPTRLHEASPGRRRFLRDVASGAASALVCGTALGRPAPASASYSAYAAREKDWQERSKAGEISYSSASSLRAQLREIAPMNDEGSKLFCPNGPSSAVSPLMENKCGDRQALPSVYGRSDDAMGNSVPGFRGGAGASASTLRAELNAQAYFRDN